MVSCSHDITALLHNTRGGGFTHCSLFANLLDAASARCGAH